MSSFGPPPGFMGANTATSARDAGLPHAGVPGHLQDKVDAVLEREPAHPEPDIHFSYKSPDEGVFTLRSFLWPHRWRLAGALVLVVIETIALQAGPLLTQIGIDEGVVPGDKQVLVTVAALYVVFIVLGGITSWYRIRYTGSMGEDMTRSLRVRVFSHMERQSLDFYTDEKSGVLMTRMTSDIEALSQLFQEGLVNFAVQALTLVVISVILFILDPVLALITLVLVVPATFVLSNWFRVRSDRSYGLVRDRIAEVLSDLSESLAGIRVITAHNRRHHNVVNHNNVVGDHKQANLDAIRAASIYTPATEAIAVIGQAMVLLIGGKLVIDGNLEIGELTAFLLYLGAFFAPIQSLTQLYNGYQQGQAAVRKLGELLARHPSVPESAEAEELPPIEGAIELVDVHFGYDPDTPVLSGVDLALAAGESVAIVGPTGAGKSTIAKLITRFYDPQHGAVRIDGTDVRDVTVTSLRSQLGVVPQEPFLFAGSIRDNVAFARPDASDDEVWDALHTTGLALFVAELPEGLDTRVHERGASLSAGERQLLALARAFLARPRVLVLDEATSNLDLQSEATVEQALDALLEGRTAIIIAHRLATAMKADRIAVVDDGDIVELGTHDELVASGGYYADMYETWNSHRTT
ncbi:MAG: ABC transporter ATP-binding protein [Acidimicrobiales bacterium]